MSKLVAFLENLEEKYGHASGLERYLEEKYKDNIELENKASGQDVIFAEKQDEEYNYTIDKEDRYPMFSYNKNYNIETINKLSILFDRVREKIISRIDNTNRDISEKIINKYEDGIKKMKINNKDLSNGEKMAGKFINILKNTLIKLWSVNNLGDIVKEYLEESGVRMESYKEGYHMTDDDFCYLDDVSIDAYRRQTKDKRKNYEVIKMLQPIMHISYYEDEDEEDIESKEINGICEFYFCLN